MSLDDRRPDPGELASRSTSRSVGVVCGSVKTMRFLDRLGVDVPRWLENELVHADDTLQASVHYEVAAATDLIACCRGLGVPFGFNVESVSTRRDEIAASTDLAADLRKLLRRPGSSRDLRLAGLSTTGHSTTQHGTTEHRRVDRPREEDTSC